MAALERVMQLKRAGKGEGEIIATLRSEGVSPMEISDALNQSKIKEAVVDPNPTEGMSPSIMDLSEAPRPVTETKEEVPKEEMYAPSPTKEPEPPQSMQQQYQEQQYAPQQQAYQPQYPQNYMQQQYQEDPFSQYANQNYQEQAYAPQEYYSGGGEESYDAYSGGGYANTDAMIEVAEQVFEEKMKKLDKEIKSLREFKTIFETKVENINERLKRMERSFDKMQLDILDKVSEYGKGLDYMKKELKMVEDSFGKVVSKL